MKCVQCGKEFDGKFCPECGRATNYTYVSPQQLSYAQSPTNVQALQSPKKKISWWKIGFGAIVCFFLLSACFGDDAEEGSNSSDSSNSNYTMSEEADDDGTEEPDDDWIEEAGDDWIEDGTLGDYQVEIQSAQLSFHYDFIIVVTYQFTNNSSKSKSFDSVIHTEAYQNGVSLDKDYSYSDKYADNSDRKVQPGKSVIVNVAYERNDRTAPIEIEVSEIWSFKNEKITKTFTLD